MGLKKAFCSHCHTKNEKARIFDVNPDAKVCYCPHCMHEYEPKEVIDAYSAYIKKQVNDAYKLLYERTEFRLAYASFAHILDLDQDSIEARFGRALTLIYLSTLRRARFSDATTLITEEAGLYYRKAKNNAEYFKFLKRAFYAVEEYNKFFRKRLTIRSYFYDDECIKLMYYRVNEIKLFKDFLYKEAIALADRCPDMEIQTFVANLTTELTGAHNELEDKVMALDGHTYGLAGFSTNGGVILGREADAASNGIKVMNPKSLRRGDKHASYIKDQVFPDNTQIYHFIRKAIPWEIVSFLVGLAILLVTVFVPTHPYLIAMYILGGAFVSLTLFLVCFSIIGTIRLKKRRYLIN